MRNSLDPDQRISPISSDLAAELVAASGAHATDKVLIAGADQLDFLVALIQRGFSQVACQSADCGPHASKGDADILIAPHVRSETDLLHILQRLGRVLGPRGVFVAYIVTPSEFGNERRLRQIFLEAGFGALERLPSRAGIGNPWCARRQAASMAWAA